MDSVNLSDFLVKLLISSFAVLIYYRFVLERFGTFLRPMFNTLRLERRYPAREVDGVVRLPLAAVSQALFLWILILITRVELISLVLNGFQPILFIYGILIGMGEMALATFLCQIAIRTVMAVAPSKGPIDFEDWLVIARGGWMQLYLKTLKLVPAPIALLPVILYISGEEIIFRGILITYFRPAGTALALLAPAFFFTLVQTFHMPSWRTAMFPVIGAIVVSVVHGTLFLAVPNVLPLILAHFVYFASAVYIGRG